MLKIRKNLTPSASILETCEKLLDRDYISCFGGNVSVRTPSNNILITPATGALTDLAEDDLVLTDINGLKIMGELNPSKDTEIHRAIYNLREDVGAVIICHPARSLAYSSLHLDIIPRSPEAKKYLREIPELVPFKDMKDLSEKDIVNIINHNVFCLSENGVVAYGKNLTEALNYAKLTEDSAITNMYMTILSLGR